MQSNELLMKQFLKKIYPNDPCPCGTETDFGRVVGDELIPLFTFAIRLITDTEIRIDRLKAREKQNFSDRIMPGGDMYTHHMEFIDWARRYDTGSVNMRSRAKHDEWQKLLKCRQIVLDGADDLEENFKKVYIEMMMLSKEGRSDGIV